MYGYEEMMIQRFAACCCIAAANFRRCITTDWLRQLAASVGYIANLNLGLIGASLLIAL